PRRRDPRRRDPEPSVPTVHRGTRPRRHRRRGADRPDSGPRRTPPGAVITVAGSLSASKGPIGSGARQASASVGFGHPRCASRRPRRECDDVPVLGRPIMRRLTAWTAGLAVLGTVALATAPP